MLSLSSLEKQRKKTVVSSGSCCTVLPPRQGQDLPALLTGIMFAHTGHGNYCSALTNGSSSLVLCVQFASQECDVKSEVCPISAAKNGT